MAGRRSHRRLRASIVVTLISVLAALGLLVASEVQHQPPPKPPGIGVKR